MDTSRVRALLREKLNQGMTEREIGREVGVAHTTIGRILDGENIAAATLEKVAAWLETNPAELAYGDVSDVSKAISVIIAQEPALKEIFIQLAERMEAGDISPEIARELIRYTAWRLNDAVSSKPKGEGTS